MRIDQPGRFEAGALVDRKRGPAVWTRSGRMFPLLEPKPGDIDIDDIAHSLAHQCRWTGHIRPFYSVAQHSVHVSRLVPPEHAFQALLHDAAEAYIGDLSRPLKRLLNHESHGFLEMLEVNILLTVLQTFALPWPLHDAVRLADEIALATEARDLFAVPPVGVVLPEPDPVPLVAWTPPRARIEFQHRFRELYARAQP